VGDEHPSTAVIHWYWASGSNCGGAITGTGGSNGPIPLRIGSSLSSPPAGADYYVLRHVVGGTIWYEAYINGTLLQGTDANGNNRIARVSAASVCWDTDSNRQLVWFGETFNASDSMGG
jgi:hypothetical protein